MIVNDNVYHIIALIKQKANQWPHISDADKDKDYHLVNGIIFISTVYMRKKVQGIPGKVGKPLGF